MCFSDLPDGAKFRLTYGGRVLTKRGDGFVTPWGATVPCGTPRVHVIRVSNS